MLKLQRIMVEKKNPSIPLSYMKANKAVFDKKETQDLDRIINDLETRFKKPNEFGTIAQENRRMFIEWIVP